MSVQLKQIKITDGVFACLRADAGSSTLGGAGATGDRGVDDLRPTVTAQLFKADVPAGATVIAVTRLLALMQAARELV